VSSVFHEWQVATAAALLPEATAPQYQSALRSAKREGEVVVLCVVDTAGVVKLASFKVMRPSEAWFAEAIKVAFLASDFRRLGLRTVGRSVSSSSNRSHWRSRGDVGALCRRHAHD